MSKHIAKSIIASACEQRTDHSEEVENIIKEVVVKGSAILTIVDQGDTGVIL